MPSVQERRKRRAGIRGRLKPGARWQPSPPAPHQMSKLKPFAITIALALVAIAIASRVPFIGALVYPPAK